MVSIKGALTLAAVGVAVVLFFSAGSFKGVGTKIGGFFGQGFSDFSSSITSSFTGGLFGGNTNQNTGGESSTNTGGGTPTPTPTGTGGGGILDQLNPITSQLNIFQGIIDNLLKITQFTGSNIGNLFPKAEAVKLTGIDRSFALGRLTPIGTTFSEGFRTSQGLKVFGRETKTGRIIAVTNESAQKLRERGIL